MRTSDDEPWLAGVDGSAGGWLIALLRPVGDEARLRVVPRFADILASPEAPAFVAVDMPIGLPERAGPGGRAAENAVRPLVGERQSSVFSVPSRAAIYAPDYREALLLAFQTSEPPRKVSKKLYNIAGKSARWTKPCAPRPPPRGACSKCIRKWHSGESTANAR
jgi:predicted RNase H-like nuclease